jgi:4-amino-4-deoxy-L-arabinose transferase-like glycosyltransferase
MGVYQKTIGPITTVSIRRLDPLFWLWLAALLLLLLPGLDAPIRDWDEGIVARVAYERAQALLQFSQGAINWRGLLLPTYWSEPYLNKPPGLHLPAGLVLSPWVSAGALPPPWAVRLVPALTASAVVPLAGLISRQLRHKQAGTALAAAAITLTLLPLMRHGRLAMLDGSLVSASGLLWWQLLVSRQSRSWNLLGCGLLSGLACSTLLLLKAPLVLPVLGIGLLLLLLERQHSSTQWLLLFSGLALGLLPGLGWHLLHYIDRGSDALLLWGADGASRVLLSSGEGSDLGWRVPVLEVLEGGWPWLALWPFAVVLAWRQRQQSSGRWTLGLQLSMAIAVLPLRTQLPWYSHILWLPFALLCGPALAELVHSGRPRAVPLLWLILGIVLIPAAFVLPQFRAVLLPAGGALLAGGWGLRSASHLKVQAAIAMVGLWWLGLLLLFNGPLWHWELNEKPPVAAAAALAKTADATLPLALWGHGERPSLSWQSQRQLVPLARLGIPAGPVQLLSPAGAPIPEVANRHCDQQASSEDGWSLWFCAPRP